MSKRKIIDGTQIHEGSANVYRDLGYADAGEMLVKAQLVAKIGEIIRGRELTQVAAARTLGITQAKLSGLLRGQLRGISERKLLACPTSLGRDVQIAVKSAARQASSASSSPEAGASSAECRARHLAAPPAPDREGHRPDDGLVPQASLGVCRPRASRQMTAKRLWPRVWRRKSGGGAGSGRLS